MVDGHDPVQARDDGTRDLYDVASWEVRSPLDGIAVTLYRVLRVTAIPSSGERTSHDATS